MTSNHLLLYRLAELMLEHEQHILPVDLLFDDEQIGDFVKSIQIDSPYQQMVLEGVLTESVRDEKLFVSFTVEGYFHYVLGEVIYNQTKGMSPEFLKQIVEENKLNGAKEGVEQCLIRDVLVDDLTRLTWLIDKGGEKLELCLIPLLYSLKSHGAKKTIDNLLENPTENDWITLSKLDSQLAKLQLHILRNEFLILLINNIEYGDKESLKIALKAITTFEKEVAIKYFNEIELINTNILDDGDILLLLGGCEYKFGNYDKTLEYYEKCLSLQLDNTNLHHLDIALSYINIGAVWSQKGNYEKALYYYEKSLSIRIKNLGFENPDIAILYNNIGYMFFKKEDYDQAFEYHVKSLNILIKTLGRQHLDVAMSYSHFGSIFEIKEDFEKALDYYEKSLDIHLKILGEKASETAISFSNLGSLFAAKNDHIKAHDYYQKSLTINLITLGKNHPDTAKSYINIGSNLHYDSDYYNAIKYYKKGLSIFLNTFGSEHPLVATSYNNIGSSFIKIGNLKKALYYYNKSLSLRLKSLGSESSFLVKSYDNIGFVLRKKGDFFKAIKYFEKSLAIQIKSLGDKHPDLAYSYNNIGDSYKDLNKYKKGIIFFLNGFNISPKGGFCFKIAQCYEALNQHKEALGYYIQSAEIRKEDIGIEDEATQESITNAKRLAKELNKENELLEWMKNNNL